MNKSNLEKNTYLLEFQKEDGELLHAEYILDTLYIKIQVIFNLFVSGKGKVFDDFTRVELLYTADDGVVELDYSALLER